MISLLGFDPCARVARIRPGYLAVTGAALVSGAGRTAWGLGWPPVDAGARGLVNQFNVLAVATG